MCITKIDWSATTGAMLQGIGTITGAVVVLIVAIIGSLTWSRQKRAEKKAVQAERILTVAYKAQRGLSMVRNPIVPRAESDAAEAKLKKEYGASWNAGSASEQSKWRTAQVYFNRLEQIQNVREDLLECQPIALALFGEKLEIALKDIDEVFQAVLAAVIMERDTGGRNTDSEFERNNKEMIFSTYPSINENKINQKIIELIMIIKRASIPALRFKDDR